MSAHQIATAIEKEATAFCRSRFTNAESYLEAKDAHCRRVSALVGQLRRAIGTTERLTLRTGRRQSGRHSFDVVARARLQSAKA